MLFLIKWITVWIFLFSLLSANEISWEGKWHINWKSGTFILHLQENGLDVNGSYIPSNGSLKGTIKDHVLTAKTLNKNGISDDIILTMSDSGKSFFGKTSYGDWITGIRVDKDSQFNTIKLDQSIPFKAFYTFLALGNSVREGNYEILEKTINIIYFNEDQDKLIHATKLALIQKFFYVIDECIVDSLDFFKT